VSRPPVPPDRLSRLLTLLHYLLDETRSDTVPVTDIEQALGLDRAEIEADINLLNLVNHGGGTYVIFASLEGDHVSVSRETLSESHERPSRLTPLLAKALFLALDLLGKEGEEGGAVLASIRQKLAHALGDDAGDEVGITDALPADDRVLAQLREAVTGREIVRIEYFTPARGELSEREVEPHFLIHGGPGWYVQTWCLAASDERTFRLDRIRTVEKTGRRFQPRPALDYRAHPEIPGHTPSASSAIVSFPAGQRLRLEEEGYEVEAQVQEDRVRARIPYLEESWLARVVLSQGGNAVVESPAALRKTIREEAAELLRRYQRGEEAE